MDGHPEEVPGGARGLDEDEEPEGEDAEKRRVAQDGRRLAPDLAQELDERRRARENTRRAAGARTGTSPRPAKAASVASRIPVATLPRTRRIERDHREAERREPETEPEDPVPEEGPADRRNRRVQLRDGPVLEGAAQRRHAERIEQLPDPLRSRGGKPPGRRSRWPRRRRRRRRRSQACCVSSSPGRRTPRREPGASGGSARPDRTRTVPAGTAPPVPDRARA